MRHVVTPGPPDSSEPASFCYDRPNLGISNTTTVLPGAQLFGATIVPTSGFRRFRVKIRLSSQLPTTAQAASVLVNLIGFDRTTPDVWQLLVFGPFPAAVQHRLIVEWGAGTGVAECEMGPFAQVGFRNDAVVGPGFRCPEAEFWAQ